MITVEEALKAAIETNALTHSWHHSERELPEGRECKACDLITALSTLNEEVKQLENELRRELWLNHGHPYEALYGDDGELQCQLCPCDFKRQPLDEVRRAALVARAAQPSAGHERDELEEPWPATL